MNNQKSINQTALNQSALIEAMREKKKEYGFSYGEIAKRSGLPLGTVQKVLGGFTKSPRRETLTALAGFLLAEDHPSELIDGVIYNMSSPTLRHQSVSGAIYRQLWNYVDSQGGDCIPFIAPTDVRLDRDERTMVVPDVFVICQPDDDRMDNDKYINGAPDLIIEVLSPSTRRKDMFTKLHKYEAAGVREYWIVDPNKEKVIVYIFGEESDVSLYRFDSEVPVGIYQGKCRIDFQRVVRDLKRLHL